MPREHLSPPRQPARSRCGRRRAPASRNNRHPHYVPECRKRLTRSASFPESAVPANAAVPPLRVPDHGAVSPGPARGLSAVHFLAATRTGPRNPEVSVFRTDHIVRPSSALQVAVRRVLRYWCAAEPRAGLQSFLTSRSPKGIAVRTRLPIDATYRDLRRRSE